MSVEASTEYFYSTKRAKKLAKHLVDAEGLAPDNDVANAIFEQRYGIGVWPVLHLASGKAKKCDLSLFGRLRAAYLGACERQLTKLQHEIAIEKAMSDDSIEDLEAEARALAAKIQARKAALR